ncbi:hypothetical protein [Maridesulfovibrio sp.]|uniref:hypothetical protein n=1 Tax=Maridesulfovibrio sp. TaxID=2795000 RepID=UPI003BA97C97
MKPKDQEPKDTLYAGITDITLYKNSFTLIEGIELRKTYCHLFSTNMMAFNPPGPEGFHPAPWKPAKGGFSYDIEVEIVVSPNNQLSIYYPQHEIVWIIASLLRITQYPYLSVPVLSGMSFNAVSRSSKETLITPFEIEKRYFSKPLEGESVLNNDVLEWMQQNIVSVVKMLNSHPKLYNALKAFDSSAINGKVALGMLALWGGIEELFLGNKGELRFRIAAYLASYLEEPGQERYNLYKKIAKLYNDRSTAAHTTKDINIEPFVETYLIMRNALLRIIESQKIPNQNELESLLFGCKINKRTIATA